MARRVPSQHDAAVGVDHHEPLVGETARRHQPCVFRLIGQKAHLIHTNLRSRLRCRTRSGGPGDGNGRRLCADGGDGNRPDGHDQNATRVHDSSQSIGKFPNEYGMGTPPQQGLAAGTSGRKGMLAHSGQRLRKRNCLMVEQTKTGRVLQMRLVLS